MSTAELLGRPLRLAHSAAASALVEGRRAVVTGGAGSIGSELVRELVRLGAERVYVLDHDESALHALALELDGHGLLTDERWVLADVRDAAGLGRRFAEIRPDLVFHAAAHKHLPLLERYPAEAVRANVLGTLHVVRASLAAGVQVLVNVSTDKAARPTSVLGWSKRLAESVVAAHAGGRTRLASVRFGNVLGSRGSFLHGMVHQVTSGAAVTVTHPDVTRFFMTIPEAAGLVVEAAVMADAGETYVLDMGTPVRIVDLVARYADLSGAPEPRLAFTGLRPGEKLHEELVDPAEAGHPTGHPRISAVRLPDPADLDLFERVGELATLAATGDAEEVRAALAAACGDCGVALPVH